MDAERDAEQDAGRRDGLADGTTRKRPPVGMAARDVLAACGVPQSCLAEHAAWLATLLRR